MYERSLGFATSASNVLLNPTRGSTAVKSRTKLFLSDKGKALINWTVTPGIAARWRASGIVVSRKCIETMAILIAVRRSQPRCVALLDNKQLVSASGVVLPCPSLGLKTTFSFSRYD